MIVDKGSMTIQWGRGQSFQQMVQESRTSTRQRRQLDPDHTLYMKTNSKWTKDLNVRPKTIKLIDENRHKLHNFGFGNDFLTISSRAQATATKKDNWT